MKNTLLIFGYGYTSAYIAERFDSNLWNIIGTSRSGLKGSTDKYIPLKQKEAIPPSKPSQGGTESNIRIINYRAEQIRTVIDEITHIIISIPPDENGDIVLKDFEEILLDAPKLVRVGYLSSTSVYGNHEGRTVDENSALKSETSKGKNRILAERGWINFAINKNLNLDIFRLAGIYGPDRNALEALKNGKAISIYKKNQLFSRIHVEDIANIVHEAFNDSRADIIERGMKKESLRPVKYKCEIYNIADDYPCSTIEVNEFAAKLLNMEAPKIIDFETLKLSDPALSDSRREFYADNKIVDNTKIKQRLNIKLKYPTFRDGLKYLV